MRRAIAGGVRCFEAGLFFLGERGRSVLGSTVYPPAGRANIGVDFYNPTNANTPTTFEATYDPASRGERWIRPTAVLQPRFMRLNVQFDF